MSWILFSLWFLVFILLVGKLRFFRNSGLKRNFLIFIFTLKIIAGSGLTLLYTFHYNDRKTSDIWKYYDDAEIIYSALKTNPVYYLELMTGINENAGHLQPFLEKMENRSSQSQEWLTFTQSRNFNFFNSNRFITRFNALIRPLTAGNIYTNVVFFCFISLAGLTALFRQTRHLTEGKEIPAIVFIFLIPSTLLWCSGVLKDGLILCFVNFLTWMLFPEKNNPWSYR